MIPKEGRIYKILKTIYLSRQARNHDVRFRYSSHAGTNISGGMREFVKVDLRIQPKLE
ncbi:MAG TPA: hypothetical protein VKR32_18790 [Puia sp.]|nr:hypothetical protein [Puia sp.]